MHCNDSLIGHHFVTIGITMYKNNKSIKSEPETRNKTNLIIFKRNYLIVYVYE